MNQGLLVWNMVVLLCVAFLPFAIVTFGDYPASTTTVILFAAAQAATALACVGMWNFAARTRLVREDTDPRVFRHVNIRMLVVGIVFLLSIPVALVSRPAAYLMWPLVLIVFYVVDRRTPASARV
jgi:uncharacterized membrane protein